MLPKDENLVKRESRGEFLTATSVLQQSFVSKIESKINIKTIGAVLDHM